MKRSPWIGYLIAPFTAPLLYGIIILFFPVVYERNEFCAESWFLSVSIFIFASYVICFIAGAPLIFFLKRFNRLTFAWLAIIGPCLYALIINVILFNIMEPTISGDIYIIVMETTLISLVMGMVITTVFSYLAGITSASTLKPKAGRFQH